MDFCSDKTLNFLAAASTNIENSAHETMTTFSTAEQSTTSSSKNSLQILTHSDPLFATLREWLNCRSQYLPDEEDRNEVQPNESKPNKEDRNEVKPNESKPNEEDRNEVKPSESKPNEEDRNEAKPDELKPDESELDLLDSGLHFVDMAATALEALVQNKDDLRHYLKVPVAGNGIPLHFNQHKSFLDVVQCLSEVGGKYEDYSKLNSENVIISLQKCMMKLEEEEKSALKLQSLSINTAADTEEVRKKKVHYAL